MTKLNPVAEWVDQEKYRQKNESFSQKCGRVAGALSDTQEDYEAFKDILKDQRFLPGGRVQSAVGSYRTVTAFNCFVMRKVPDSFDGIMDVLKEAGTTMRMGGGVGYDFSGIRPKGDPIKSLDSFASGPLSFMEVYNTLCGTISSAGHRRGAQMGCLRVDHPDILDFISAKTESGRLTNFNVSVLVTDDFMRRVEQDKEFDLVFEGKVYNTVRAKGLWETILRNTWDWAEPGVIFIDRVNEMNNLHYMEDISSTNPCGEQPLPPYGACLLGSFNLTKYVDPVAKVFSKAKLRRDIPYVVRAMDNVIDETVYPLKEQEEEAKNKRRMGLGITGYCNTVNALGYKYGSKEALEFLEDVMETIARSAYYSSVSLAMEKGAFPAFTEEYCDSNFVKQFEPELQEAIRKYGIRNSHLTSIAPTGTISMTANNVSSGIEPTFAKRQERDIIAPEGVRKEILEDYAFSEWGVEPDTIETVSVKDHVNTLTTAQKWVDSAVSKTCNVPSTASWEEFKDVYWQAYIGGAKGCTTYRDGGKRGGILTAVKEEEEGAACMYNPETGERSCE